jgi:transcriptional regulator GlxA family with amidase domain
VRSLHRYCLQVLDTTPAKLVEKLRVEHARTLLTTSQLGTKTIAARCGFGAPARMARAFDRTLGVAPSAYRMMFSPRRDRRDRVAPAHSERGRHGSRSDDGLVRAE